MQPQVRARRPRAIIPLALGLGLGLACAKETSGPVGPAEVTPLCGTSAPLRLLGLAGDERLMDLTRIGDRYYVTVRIGSEYADPTMTYGVGLCGEDPRVVAEDLRRPPFTLTPWPDTPVACRGPDHVRCDLVSLDPSGDLAPTLLAPAPPGVIVGPMLPIDDGLLIVVVGIGEVDTFFTHYRFSDGPTPALTAGVSIDEVASAYAIAGDDLFLVTIDDSALLRVSLADGSTSVEASSASDIAASATHLLYTTSGDPSGVFLRERETGIETLLADCQSDLDLDARTARVACINDDGGTIVDLGSGAQVSYGPGRRVSRQINDGRWLLTIDYTPDALLDVLSGVETELAVPPGSAVAEADALLVWQRNASASPDSEESLLEVPYDGGPAETIARRASRDALRLSDGRVVTDVALDDGSRGLVVVERGSLDERLIDTAVTFFTDGDLDFAYVSRPADATLDPDVIAYQVDDGERSGIYLVALGEGGG
ncbi:MAG: hypothetical protein H6710_09450 [Myxococcales bacterium]|nr:hypothetical protein [Myxococcales bacterium]